MIQKNCCLFYHHKSLFHHRLMRTIHANAYLTTNLPIIISKTLYISYGNTDSNHPISPSADWSYNDIAIAIKNDLLYTYLYNISPVLHRNRQSLSIYLSIYSRAYYLPLLPSECWSFVRFIHIDNVHICS